MGAAPAIGELNGYEPISDIDRKEFHEQGYVYLPNVLSEEHRQRLEAVVDRIYEEEKAAGHLSKDGTLHLLGMVSRDTELARMLDFGPTFRYVWGLAGWNIYSQHNHIDVNPPFAEEEIPRWEWHQDGWRQNSDAEYHPMLYGQEIPRPMLSLKVAFVLSDLSQPGRGQTKMIPGSNLRNHMHRPSKEEVAKGVPDPDGATEWIANPGDAFVFDRRLWHSRTRNDSQITRKMLFISYTYRWIRPVDDMPLDRSSPWYHSLTPVQKQLVGECFGTVPVQNYWGVREGGWIDDEIPLRKELIERGLLDRSIPWLR